MYKIVSRIQLTVSGEQRNGSSVLASTAGTTNTVDVVLRVVRVIVVQHMGDVANIFELRKERVSKRNTGMYSNLQRGT